MRRCWRKRAPLKQKKQQKQDRTEKVWISFSGWKLVEGRSCLEKLSCHRKICSFLIYWVVHEFTAQYVDSVCCATARNVDLLCTRRQWQLSNNSVVDDGNGMRRSEDSYMINEWRIFWGVYTALNSNNENKKSQHNKSRVSLPRE